MDKQLLMSALWPYALLALVIAAIAVQGAVSHFRAPAAALRRTAATTIVLERSLYAAILIFYLVLPGVSRSIFKARQCASYSNDDALGTRRSYLLADLSVKCSAAKDADFASLDAYFWSFFALWPMLVPLAFLLLLAKVRPAVRAQRLTPLAVACRFLWRDYNAGLLFWEVIDLLRRLLLTSIILFVGKRALL